ncbi:MAG: preprotein translocase subunit SecB [Methylococcaceae bacterium]
MNESLQKAIESLVISDISLRHSHCDIEDGFEPKHVQESVKLTVEHKHEVVAGQILQLTEDGSKTSLFRVFIEVGARWTHEDESSDGEAQNQSNEDGDPLNVLATIESTYIAEYIIKEHPGDDALKEFALNNASYHVWPYWREYLMSQCSRMNLPKMALPMTQFSRKEKAE